MSDYCPLALKSEDSWGPWTFRIEIGLLQIVGFKDLIRQVETCSSINEDCWVSSHGDVKIPQMLN